MPSPSYQPFDPLPPGNDGLYFGVALAAWSLNYAINRRPPDCWYVVRVYFPQENAPKVRYEFTSTESCVLSRFRHPEGRLYYYEEGVVLVNKLNTADLAVAAASTTPGGLSKYVHQLARQML